MKLSKSDKELIIDALYSYRWRFVDKLAIEPKNRVKLLNITALIGKLEEDD